MISVGTATRAVLRMRGRGFLPSKDDPRDLLAAPREADAAPVPTTADLIGAALARRIQGSTNSCTTHATDHAAQALCLQGEGPKSGAIRRDYSLRSVLDPYWYGRAVDGLETSDEGALLRSIFKGYARRGVCSDASWPMRTLRVNSQPGAAAMRDAHPWRGLRYSRIRGGYEGVLYTLGVRRKPVVGGWYVDSAFMRDDGPDTLRPVAGPTLGGHAIALLGYDASGRVRLPNSWPTSWRDGGWAWGSPEWCDSATELWAIEGWL